MGPEASLPCSQEPATDPHLKLDACMYYASIFLVGPRKTMKTLSRHILSADRHSNPITKQESYPLDRELRESLENFL